MSNWVVTIPSYKRAHVCNTQTLRTLADGGVPAERIFVGVVTEEADEYHKTLDPALYADLVVYPWHNAMAGACEELQAKFTPGDVVQLDDDVRSIMRKVDDKTLDVVDDLPALFDRGFGLCRVNGLTLWGIYPVQNAMFMKHRIRTDLTLCVGHMFGHILSGRACEASTLNAKNDYERCLQHFMADGGVLRFDDIAAKSKVYSQAGGLQGIRDAETARQEIALLMARFPGLVKHKKVKGDMPEIRLVQPA